MENTLQVPTLGDAFSTVAVQTTHASRRSLKPTRASGLSSLAHERLYARLYDRIRGVL